MRVQSTVTAITWIPAMSQLSRTSPEVQLYGHDDPPPDALPDEHAFEELHRRFSFRYAHRHAAWAEFDDSGAVVEYGYGGGLAVAPVKLLVSPGVAVPTIGVPMPLLRPTPRRGDGWITLTQLGGRRTSSPMPRIDGHEPTLHLVPPVIWTSLELTLFADGGSSFALTDYTPFPPVRLYGPDGRVAEDVGTVEWNSWAGYRGSGDTPWGGADSREVTAAAEQHLYDAVRAVLRDGAEPVVIDLDAGEVLIRDGDTDTTLYVVLDGILRISAEGRRLGDVGCGAVLDRRSGASDPVGRGSVRAVTAARVFAVPSRDVDEGALRRLLNG